MEDRKKVVIMDEKQLEQVVGGIEGTSNSDPL